MYYKDRKEIIDAMDDMDDMDSENVVEEVNGAERSCLRNEVDGGGGNGSSFSSNDMKEFHECINDIELEDVNNSSFFFTWTESLKNPDCKTLKKLDRIMVSEEFISKYLDAHGCFLPFVISNHSPTILIMKNGVAMKKRAFRIEWLNEGNRSTSFFHKVLKERKHRRRIMATCDESGKRHENEEVADQFLKHFKKFLGKEDKVETMDGFGFHNKWIKWVMTCITTAKFTINVNGERVGYFNGGRGFRQGDLIAPYLFTLVMKVLNLLMKKNISETTCFRYHLGCKRLKITQICFVGDLMVFCNGDTSSAKVVKRTLEEFSRVSGLKPNMQKSTIFIRGTNVMEQNCILKLIPFSVGKLPMRYLGVPLITKQLSVSECKPFIEKVEKRILNWKNRTLTYAGRLQLVASVLNSM
ncbi:RNA-directed DNA polymerase, eukaryota, reverse transcriptase zinc-binding domain protein [Tanacetum coccineum]